MGGGEFLGGSVNLAVGENRGLFTELSLGITFDDMDRLSGSIFARHAPESGEIHGFFLRGDAALWRAAFRSEFGCPSTCFSTGIWELDRSTIPEPGGLPLVLAGLLGVGLLTSRSTSLSSPARGPEDCR